jgi:YjjI family glycine radical enzyme
MDLHELRDAAREAVTSRTLTSRQQLHRLAQIGESLLPYPKLGAEAAAALETGLLCDLLEGPAPYRPRYVLPDYAQALANGSAFLELDPPTDLDEALDTLAILYHHVPSITTYPVFLGHLDELLLPFTHDVDDAALHRRLTRFWRYLDRTLPDAFTHANVGPTDNRVARTLLRIDRELAQVVPNLTLRFDPLTSGDGLLLEAARSIAAVNKPHVAHHPMIAADFPEGYGVVSCYNTLPLGGGSHTLVRLNLAESGRRHRGDVEAYLADTLPRHLALLLEAIRARVDFLVEESGFFGGSFLAAEGLIHADRFTAMAGIYGLAELVDGLLADRGLRYGVDREAAELAQRIVATAAAEVACTPVAHCRRERAVLHAQSGISTDVDVTAGTRIPIGREPEIVEHLLTVAPLQRAFAGGVSDIVALDASAAANPEALVDLVRGAFASGLREVTFNVEGSDLVRVTGYMVRRSDVERWRREGSRLGSTALGAESIDNWHLLERTARVISSETLAWTERRHDARGR